MLEGVGRAVCLRYSSPSCKGSLPCLEKGRRPSCRDYALTEEAVGRELLAKIHKEEKGELFEDLRQNGMPNSLQTIEKRLKYMQVRLRHRH